MTTPAPTSCVPTAARDAKRHSTRQQTEAALLEYVARGRRFELRTFADGTSHLSLAELNDDALYEAAAGLARLVPS